MKASAGLGLVLVAAAFMSAACRGTASTKVMDEICACKDDSCIAAAQENYRADLDKLNPRQKDRVKKCISESGRSAYEKASDEVCACRDKACVDALEPKFKGLLGDTNPDSLSGKDAAAWERLGECVTRFH